MAFIRVSLVELLCQVVMEQIPALEYLLSGARGLLCHIPSWQALNAAASQGPGAGNAYPLPKAPGCTDQMPESSREVGRADT
jgi:hypothetical protein